MKYEVETTNKFNKGLQRCKRRNLDIKSLWDVVEVIALGEKLPAKYKDHKLHGKYKDYRECHIEPDWLLIYKIDNDKLILTLTNTGSHSDLKF